VREPCLKWLAGSLWHAQNGRVREVDTVEELFAWLESGQREFDAEPVAILDHGLQCASLLASARPDDLELHVAGLIHDLGSVLSPGHPATHAATGATAVRRLLGRRVADLVEGHDVAKRYLVTTEADYREHLTPQSRATLRVQGGLMDPDERSAFEGHWVFESLCALRRADDRAKVPGLIVPGLSFWRDRVDALTSTRAR
jgi:predicted HD phosphohydrolase